MINQVPDMYPHEQLKVHSAVAVDGSNQWVAVVKKVIRVFGRDFQLAIKWCVLNELFWKQLGYDKLTSLLVFNVFLEKNTF